MTLIKITKILTYSYTTPKYTITIKKGGTKYSKPLDLAILLFSHSSIRLCKSPPQQENQRISSAKVTYVGPRRQVSRRKYHQFHLL
jgi:hypothetical protein